MVDENSDIDGPVEDDVEDEDLAAAWGAARPLPDRGNRRKRFLPTRNSIPICQRLPEKGAFSHENSVLMIAQSGVLLRLHSFATVDRVFSSFLRSVIFVRIKSTCAEVMSNTSAQVGF